jgi:ubiquinone/menaquinone biosynthesis C-methylase UbiE
VDVSKEMLDCAPRRSNITYQVCPAENLPFTSESFDLITVGLAFHWFDQDQFLRQAHRVLKQSGWLVIFTNGFNGEMRENAEFKKWAWEDYPARYPTPPRRSTMIDPDWARSMRFELRGTEPFQNEVTMTSRQLTDYLLTQTNVIALVEQGSEPIEDVARWIHETGSGYFHGKSATMLFSGRIWYLQKI